MRFMCRMESTQVADLVAVLSALGRCGKMVHLAFAPDKVFLGSISDDDAIVAFADLEPRVMFSEFRSESRAGNIVNLEAPTDMLLGCLKHGAQASSTVMKLSKRHGSPSLSCVVSRDDGITLTHDVPVLVVRRTEAEAMERPDIPEMSVLMQIHGDDPFKAVVDRMKMLAKHVHVEIDPRGAMAVSAQNEIVAVKSFFRDLTPLELRDAAGEVRPSEAAAAKVDARLLSKVLMACSGHKRTALVVGSSPASVFFVHMRLSRGAGGVTVLIPVVQEASDDALMPGLAATPEAQAAGSSSSSSSSSSATAAAAAAGASAVGATTDYYGDDARAPKRLREVG